MGPYIPCNTLHILHDTYGRMHLQARNDDDDDGSVASVLNFEVIAPQGVVQKILPSLPQSLFDITTLILNTNLFGDLMRDTLGNLPRLQKIILIGACTGEFIKELSGDYDEPSDNYPVTFPALEFLWIKNVDFDEDGLCTVEELQDCLMKRYERKAGLLKLKLTNCYELYSHMEKLREFVVDVEWGIEADSDSD